MFGGFKLMGTHNIHITIDDDDFKKLIEKKGDLSWYEFIMTLCD